MIVEFMKCYIYFYSNLNGVCCVNYKMVEGVC